MKGEKVLRGILLIMSMFLLEYEAVDCIPSLKVLSQAVK